MKKNFKKVLLLRPPATLRKGARYFGVGEPLGLLYIAAMLEKRGFEVEVLDGMCSPERRASGGLVTYGMPLAEMAARLRGFGPDLVGVSWFTNSNEPDVARACALVRKTLPGVPVAVGGSYPTMFPADTLARLDADFAVLGEGEYRLPALLGCLSRGADPDFDGVAFRKGGKVAVNPLKTWIADLDKPPYPARRLADMEKYREINRACGAADPEKILLTATRGCFGRCAYCSVPASGGPRIRARSAANVLGEIKRAKREQGAKTFYFVDNNILFDRRRFKELLAGLAALRVRWEVPLGFYPDLLDAETIHLMARAGLSSLTLAVESGSREILARVMKKKVDLDRVPGLAKEARSLGLPVSAFFIVGVPGETERTLLETLKFAARAGFDAATFHYFVPLTGTELHRRALAEGYLKPGRPLLDEVMSGEPALDAPPGKAGAVITRKRLVELVTKFSPRA